MFSSTPSPSRIQKIHPPIFFSLFKKWKKTQINQFKKMHVLSKLKKKLIEQKHPIKKASMQQKIFLKKIQLLRKKNPLCFFC